MLFFSNLRVNPLQINPQKISAGETFGIEYAPNEAKQTQYEKSPNKRKGVCFADTRELPNHQQGLLLLRDRQNAI